MGDFNVRAVKDNADIRFVHKQILDDIEAFDHMLANRMFDEGQTKIGAEQELCIIDRLYRPSSSALSILSLINEKRYTNELALYNLEINLDPFLFEHNCFSDTEKQLLTMIEKGRLIADQFDANLILTGILPTLKFRHLEFEYMTPIERYRTLSEKLSEMRGEAFEIYVQGVDDLIMSLPTVLFEACNTSFQLHLQIHPDEFIQKYNWSQAISGPVLSACVNSPLLFGRELWAETRIAIFKQSLDTRSSSNHMRRKLPRVYFGDQWLMGSPTQLLKEQAIRFPVILTSDDLMKSTEMLDQGKIPSLRAAMLHNGTTYTWNRLCYGHHSSTPHLRIECRYIPAGPSPIDEMANFAFWSGLMSMAPDNQETTRNDFRSAKNNFMKAARYGLGSIMEWQGKSITAQKLILETLLPLAEAGLRKNNINETDIQHYLGVFAQRVEREQTGSQWLVKGYRNLRRKHKITQSLQELNARSIEYQKENIPICDWKVAKSYTWITAKTPNKLVEEVMTTDVSTVYENHEISFVKRIFEWKSFHHLPVENNKGELVGIITDGMLNRHLSLVNNSVSVVHELMINDPVTLNAKDSVSKAKERLRQTGLTGIPVTYKNRLVGIITLNDLQ